MAARPEPRHERRDLDPRGVAAAVGVIVAGIAIAVGVPWIVIANHPAPANAPNNAKRPEISGPQQLTAPAEELAAYRREKEARLNGEGVDPGTGVAHIPIEQAMRLLAARRGGR